MELQQQQPGIVKTGDPQAASQPNLAAGVASLQQNGSTNVNQLSATSLSVTTTCTTTCSGSIPASSITPKTSGISPGTWLIIAVAITVAAIIAWMFRQLSSSAK